MNVILYSDADEPGRLVPVATARIEVEPCVPQIVVWRSRAFALGPDSLYREVPVFHVLERGDVPRPGL